VPVKVVPLVAIWMILRPIRRMGGSIYFHQRRARLRTVYLAFRGIGTRHLMVRVILMVSRRADYQTLRVFGTRNLKVMVLLMVRLRANYLTSPMTIVFGTRNLKVMVLLMVSLRADYLTSSPMTKVTRARSRRKRPKT
jgi:hypothetical protein